MSTRGNRNFEETKTTTTLWTAAESVTVNGLHEVKLEPADRRPFFDISQPFL